MSNAESSFDNPKILSIVEETLSTEPPTDKLMGLLIEAFRLTNPEGDLMQRLRSRIHLGLERYGHGIRASDDTREWGTRENSWMEMCEEEILDGIVYTAAHRIRKTSK
jgi:hypothetical protein